MVREILIWPDPRLKEKATPVGKVDEATKQLVADMFETMYDADGVGLAAPQIGVLQRVVVIDTSPRDEGEKPFALIDPVIVQKEGEAHYKEGCLSVPGESEEVERAAEVTVRYTDLDGKVVERFCTGLCAIAVQHELDHLEGVLFVDYLSTLKRSLIKKRMQRMKAERAEEREEAGA